jgi:hypothetical protein
MKKFSVIALSMALFFGLFFVSCGDEPVTQTDDVGTGDEEPGDDGTVVKDDALPTDDSLPTEGDTPPTEGSDIGGDTDTDSGPDTDIPTAWDEEDADGDGIKNGVEGQDDTDGDGTPDFEDTDSDGDGLSDSTEAPSGIPVDTDSDATPDYKDTDADGDGVPDGVEGTGDVDGDGKADYRDIDADGDGMPDGIECAAQPCVDTDGDTAPDFLDTDSDGDGVPDLYEGNKDMDGDGIPAYLDDDSDGDGITDATECPGQPCVDSDGDSYPDFKDKDSDNDGLVDADETTLGTDPTKADTDGDGTDDNTEHAFGSDPNDPNDDIPDDAYYYVLPYNDPAVQDTLDFSTDIKSADIMILVDLSGSMIDEHNNLKSGINNTIITGVKAQIPNSAFGLVKFGTLEDQPYALAQGITTDVAAVQSAVNGIADVGGSSEAAYEVLYQAATGAGATFDCGGGGGCSNVQLMAATTLPATTPGWRNESLPIMIMITDEELQDYSGDCSGLHSKNDALAAMNAINAKFIGVDSGGGVATAQFEEIADATGSVDSSGNGFKYEISSDGTGLSQQVVDAVVALAKGIQIDVNTILKSVPNPESIDTTQFVKAVVPNTADPADGFETKDTTTFYKVKPGTKVIFDVTFENTVYENLTSETKLFIANINVMGAGTLLDTREVFILVPGIIDQGGED